MGANAVTTVPVYTAGEVLTAADLNITNSGIPVFATTVERDAAFGGTGEKTLAEGQYAYLESTNQTLVYDGSNWVSVGVNPGLVCVKAETALSSTSVTVDNVFTSAYSNYQILLRYTTVGNNAIYARLRVGGVSASGANYNEQSISAVASTPASSRLTGQTSLQVTVGTDGDFKSSSIVTLFSPAVAEATNVQSFQNPSFQAYTGVRWYSLYGNHTLATAYDGIELICGGNMSGTYAIYGYSKTV
jgi:hypothetical protein